MQVKQIYWFARESIANQSDLIKYIVVMGNNAPKIAHINFHIDFLSWTEHYMKSHEDNICIHTLVSQPV